MTTLIYDGTFEGLMSTVFDIYYQKWKPDHIYSKPLLNQGNLFADAIEIATEQEKSDRVVNGIKSKISPFALRKVVYSYLCEAHEGEMDIFRYIKMGFEQGKKIDEMLTHPIVHPIEKLTRAISRERHRYLGILRFKKVEGDLYYAPITPRYNLISLLAPHFAERMHDQNWMIHDVQRQTAILFDQEQWFETTVNLHDEPVLADDEEYYQALWKKFFDTIAIPERHNPRCQMNFVPKRYWEFMPEME